MMAPSSRHLDVYRVMGCSTTNFHNTMFEKSLPSVLILAMKPSQLALIDPKELCQKINTLPKPFYVVSVLAGTKLSDIEAKFGKEATDIDLGDGVRFARIMPNVSCAVNSGVVGLYSRSKTTNDDLAGLFGVLGTCEVVADENQLDGIIGVTGSGIAYVLTMIQAMADGGVLCGLPRDLALRLAARTVEVRTHTCNPCFATLTNSYSFRVLARCVQPKEPVRSNFAILYVRLPAPPSPACWLWSVVASPSRSCRRLRQRRSEPKRWPKRTRLRILL